MLDSVPGIDKINACADYFIEFKVTESVGIVGFGVKP